MDLGLTGAAVCVSGGTKGLGREAALAFAREGARVELGSRANSYIVGGNIAVDGGTDFSTG